MRRIVKLAPALAFLALAGCDYPPTDQPRSVADLGIAMPVNVALAGAPDADAGNARESRE